MTARDDCRRLPCVTGARRIEPGLATCLLTLLLAAVHASAQTGQQRQPPVERPFRALFGGVQADPNRYNSLDLTLSAMGGYDDNVLVASGAVGAEDPRFGSDSTMATAAATLAYRKVRNENSVFATGRAGFRYYPSFTDVNAADYSANAGFSGRLSRRVLVDASQDVAYQPFFSLLAIPVFSEPQAGPPAMTTDYGFIERPSLAYVTNAAVTYDLTRRTRASGNYLFQGFDFTRAGDAGRWRQQRAQVGLYRDVTRRFTFGGQYTYRDEDIAYTVFPILTHAHNVEMSLEYQRTLRSRRRILLGFTPGYARIQIDGATPFTRFQRRATLRARFAVSLGRTWLVSGDYQRGFRHIPGFRRPAYADDLQLRVTGLIGRRVDLSCSSQYLKAETGVPLLSGVDTVASNVQLRWAVSRLTALAVQYVYFWYEMPADVALAIGSGRNYNRHGLRAGLDLWLPLRR